MSKHIRNPSVIQSAGNKPKVIEEYIGRVISSTEELSIACTSSPGGWQESGQTPEFGEYTVMQEGMPQVGARDRIRNLHLGEAVIVRKGERVSYNTPNRVSYNTSNNEGAESTVVCLPAFSVSIVHRDVA